MLDACAELPARATGRGTPRALPREFGLPLGRALNQLWLGEPRATLVASDKATSIARAADNLRGQALAATAAGCIHAHTEQWSSALEATRLALTMSKDPFTLVSAAWMAAWA